MESDDSPFSAWASFRDAMGQKVMGDSRARAEVAIFTGPGNDWTLIVHGQRQPKPPKRPKPPRS